MFDIITKVTKQLLDGIQNTGFFIDKELRRYFSELQGVITTHKYKVEVQNPTEKMEVKGTVIVGNQTKLESKVESVNKAILALNRIIPTLKKIEVTNQKAFPAFPKSFDIGNFPKDTRISNINMIVDAVNTVSDAVSKLKLDPKIKVDAPVIPAPVVNVPKQAPPVVKVTQEKVDLSVLSEILTFWQSLSGSAKKSLSVRLTDGDKFYKAVDRLVEEVANVQSSFQYADGNGGRAMINRNSEVQVTVADTWDVNDIDKASSTVTYFGEESVDAKWRVRKVVKAGVLTSVRHATVLNNSSYVGYESAWSDRVNLNYGYAREAL